MDYYLEESFTQLNHRLLIHLAGLGHPKWYSCFWSPPVSIFGYVLFWLLLVLRMCYSILMLILKHMASVYSLVKTV